MWLLKGWRRLPARARLTLRSKESLIGRYRSGMEISGLASINAPSAAVLPDGFNFRRHLYFQRIGGLGFFYRPPEIVDPGQGMQALQDRFAAWRQVIAQRVLEALPGQSGAVAVALLTGQRGAISDGDLDAMRYSGLAHMLAISGLHVGLFSGVVFFTLRLLMAMVPGMALNLPIKKIAAVLAFGAACFYMVLAGATIPTQRAVLMIGVVFLAVLLDRTALSMRLVSFAALVVLLMMPESLLSVSFQLSFAAVVMLIFVYDGLRGWLSGVYRHAGFLRRSSLYIGGVALTSLVATIATAPFSLYHFQTLAVFGVITNVLAMPVMSFAIMPFAVLALALMPFGFEHWPLFVMGQGIDMVLASAHMVSGWDGAVMRVSSWPFEALVAATLGGVWFVFMRGALRWIGVAGVVAALMFVQDNSRPDLYVSASQKLWAYVAEDGQFYVSDRRSERFIRENWERSLGVPEGEALLWRDDPEMRCDGLACRRELRGVKVSFVTKKEALPEECAWADIVFSKRNVDEAECAADIVVDYDAAKYGGAHGIYLRSGGRARIERVGVVQGERPWD